MKKHNLSLGRTEFSWLILSSSFLWCTLGYNKISPEESKETCGLRNGLSSFIVSPNVFLAKAMLIPLTWLADPAGWLYVSVEAASFSFLFFAPAHANPLAGAVAWDRAVYGNSLRVVAWDVSDGVWRVISVSASFFVSCKKKITNIEPRLVGHFTC